MTTTPRPEARIDVDQPPDPARPVLMAMWEMVLILDGGRVEHVVLCESQEQAEWRGSRLRSATWEVRRYMRSPSERVGPRRKNSVVVTKVNAPGPGAGNGKAG